MPGRAGQRVRGAPADRDVEAVAAAAARADRQRAGDRDVAAASWSSMTTGTRQTRWRCCCKLTGNETHTAHDGLEAVEAAATFRPDVILLDIGLPKLNGYEAARSIREQPWGKNMVLVALTGWGQDEDRQSRRRPGSTATGQAGGTHRPDETAGRVAADGGK